MGCACGGRKSAIETYVVVLPGGKKKSYMSKLAAEAEVRRVEGAYLMSPQPASS